MRARILGSAAGGAFPQWNCACAQCKRVRSGDADLVARTQDSVFVRAKGAGPSSRGVLLNASPDILAQIAATPELWPTSPRDTGIGAIVLTNGDIDHTAGLFSLRESQPLAIYATDAVREGLVGRNAMMRTLARFEGHVVWRPLRLDADTVLADVTGAPLGLHVRARAAPGKLPVHLVGTSEPSPEDNVALWITDATSKVTLVYASAAASAAPLRAHLDGVDALLWDGSFWSSDELIRLGLGTSRAEDMAHLPVGGFEGGLAALAGLRIGTRVLTHVNNTNPILDARSPERKQVEDAGFVVATDGMEIVL